MLQKHFFHHLLSNFIRSKTQILENIIMKSGKGVQKMRKTWFRKGVAPHNKGVKQEPKEKNDTKQSHYLRPSQSEVVMAGQDPLGLYGQSTVGETDNGGGSTMVLRPKKDTPLQVEKKNSGSSEG